MEKTNFEVTKEEDVDLGLQAHKWYGKEDQTNETLMHDKGAGEAITLRLFEWKFPPTIERLPTKEEILTPGYLKQIQTQLWGDGLRLVMTPEVRITKTGCYVFAPCQAATGQSFLEAPKLLQEWI